MSIILTARCRISQAFSRVGRRMHPPRKQTAHTGAGAMFSMGQILRDMKLKKPMVVFAPGTEAAERLFQILRESDTIYAKWSELSDPPTADDGENIRLSWLGEGCDCFIALGDGLVLDVTKAAAARCARRGRPIMAMVGAGKVGRRIPPVIAVPTTAGSASESLSALMVSDDRGNRFLIESPALVPPVAVLDPALLDDVPRDIVADRGMNGLCLAVESFLSANGDERAKKLAAQAVGLFFSNLEECWNTGGSAQAKEDLLMASRLAGLAASLTGYGYTRAICRAAQTVSGIHFGPACGAVLPAVLEKYGISAHEGLSALADQCGLMAEGSRAVRAGAVIDRIRGMVFRMGLPDKLSGVTGGDAEEIGDLAAADANPRCACPVVWTAKQCADLVLSLCGQPENG